jgi:predicted PurR-regulated permease PerM
MMKGMPKDETRHFVRKVWIACSIAALILVVIGIFITTFNVLLLILAGALIALYFRGLAGLIQRNLHISGNWSLLTSIIFTILFLSGFVYFAGNKISSQVQQLSETLPETISHFRSDLQHSAVGRQLLNMFSSGDGSKQTRALVQTFFKSTFGVLTDVYIVLFIGLFFTASPTTYVDGIIRLMPPAAKQDAKNILVKCGTILKKWLKGKLLAMLVVAILTLVGLLIMDVPMALVLALIAGVLNFIPNFGPVIAMIPAILIGLTMGPGTAALIAGLYIVVQVLESNLITPQIQKRLVSLSPALIIIAQLFMGVLTGGWGLLLATPLLLILNILLTELYVKRNGS